MCVMKFIGFVNEKERNLRWKCCIFVCDRKRTFQENSSDKKDEVKEMTNLLWRGVLRFQYP